VPQSNATKAVTNRRGGAADFNYTLRQARRSVRASRSCGLLKVDSDNLSRSLNHFTLCGCLHPPLGFLRASLVWLGRVVPGLYEVIQYTLSLPLLSPADTSRYRRPTRPRPLPSRAPPVSRAVARAYPRLATRPALPGAARARHRAQSPLARGAARRPKPGRGRALRPKPGRGRALRTKPSGGRGRGRGRGRTQAAAAASGATAGSARPSARPSRSEDARSSRCSCAAADRAGASAGRQVASLIRQTGCEPH